MNDNLRKVKATEQKNKAKLRQVNPYLNESSGIYILTREDENGIKYAYIGQAKHILTRLAQHMVGYQHIDLSLRKYGLFAFENPYGWKVGFLQCKDEELDKLEQHYIKQYALQGYQLRNKTAGGQGEGKSQIAEYKPSKGYRDGIAQGKKVMARELKDIINKHLYIGLKPGKENNKISIKAMEKFYSILNEEG